MDELIVEIENKLILGRQILENPLDLEKNLEKLKDVSDFQRNNWTYSTYNKYFDKEEEDLDNPKMSKKFFNKFLCSNHRLYYRTHELNEILYLHYKGFKIIENLQTFSNLKVLYLEGNSIRKIEGLNHLKQLSSLYLHENCISKIENLDGLDQLYNLNLSDNCIEKIENLSSLKSLSNLLLKRNRIGINDNLDLEGLIELPQSLTVLDISENRIEVTDYIEEKLTKISKLRVLYNQGNESVRKIRHYRKFVINTLKQLNYLDDKPVFEDERRYAEAFGRGGLEEERKERAIIKQEKMNYEMKRLKDFKELVDGWQREKKIKNGEKVEDLKSIDKEREEKESEEETKKKKEEAKNKLLNKIKGKHNDKKNQEQEEKKSKLLAITEGEIPDTESDIQNNNNNYDVSLFEKDHEIKKQIKSQKPSNDIFDDFEEEENIPELEKVKKNKQNDLINEMLEFNENLNENKTIPLDEREEIVDTTIITDGNNLKKFSNNKNDEEIKQKNEFDELD
jgi:dynein assembly factor 1